MLADGSRQARASDALHGGADLDRAMVRSIGSALVARVGLQGASRWVDWAEAMWLAPRLAHEPPTMTASTSIVLFRNGAIPRRCWRIQNAASVQRILPAKSEGFDVSRNFWKSTVFVA